MLSVVVVLEFSVYSSLSSPQDIMVKLKKYGENDEYMSHLVSYKWIRKTQVIPELGLDYKEVGRL